MGVVVTALWNAVSVVCLSTLKVLPSFRSILWVSPAELRWTDNKIQRLFTGGQSLQDVAASLRQGAGQPYELTRDTERDTDRTKTMTRTRTLAQIGTRIHRQGPGNNTGNQEPRTRKQEPKTQELDFTNSTQFVVLIFMCPVLGSAP